MGAAKARAQALPETVIPSPDVLLPNGGFDIGDSAGHPIFWSVEGAVGGVKVINRKADRTAGMTSLEITSTKGAPVSLKSQRLTAIVGGAYTLTAKVKTKSGTGASLGIQFWSFDGKQLATKDASPSRSDDWQTLKIEAVAPEGAAHVVVTIDGAKDADGVSFWDEVDLKLAPLAYDPAIGSERELFLDDYRIESAYHVERVVHPAHVTTQPVLRPDKPWESSAYIYGSVFKINDKLRMWYTAYGSVEPHYFTAYAESTDGLNWTKPNLGLVDFKGSKENNLTKGGGSIAYNPDAPPDRRYVALGFKQGVPNETMGYYISFSSDGLSWQAASDKPALLDGDVSNLCYDPVRKLYIATIKKRMFTARTPGIYERSAFISTSTDAITWTPPRLAVMGDSADDGHAESIGGLEAQIYGMPVARYESVLVGFPWIFYIHDYMHGESAKTGDGPVEVQIASSRDIFRWSRPIRTRIIDPGAPGSWDDGCHYTAATILVDDKTITMYYGAFNNGHGGSDPSDPHRGANVGQSGMATWRRDGWVSLTNGAIQALGNPGQVTTKPIVFHGKTMHLNATVRAGGSLNIQALDANGTPVPGFTASVDGDQLDAAIKWSNDKSLGDLAGSPISFRFSVMNADLYSYWIDD